MSLEFLTLTLDRKRQYYSLSKQSLAKLIGINGNLFRDVLGQRKELPKKYIQRVEDFINLPLDDYIKKYEGANQNATNSK